MDTPISRRGLPGYGFLALQAASVARRPHDAHRRLSPGRHWGHPRLGAFAFPATYTVSTVSMDAPVTNTAGHAVAASIPIGTVCFRYGRNECVPSSSAMPCLARNYHVDGLRVDAVASMLYHDYSRKEVSGYPTVHGGRENSRPSPCLRDFQRSRLPHYPGVGNHRRRKHRFPGVSKPPYDVVWDLTKVDDGLDARFAQLFQTSACSVAGTRTNSRFPWLRLSETSCCRSVTMRWCT